MTSIFFVQHAQPDESWGDDRTRPLTQTGFKDSKRVTQILENYKIDIFYSNPYKRSVDTISDCAGKLGMVIHTDERFRERKQGINSGEFLEKRWSDFNFCEEDGENLASVQKRNIEALTEILNRYAGKNIVIGTHGTLAGEVVEFIFCKYI